MGDQALHHILPEVKDDRLRFLKYVNLLAALLARKSKTLHCGYLPIDLTIDFTTFCQLHCPWCAVGNGTIRRNRATMPFSLYDSLLAEVGDSLFLVWNFSAGEPLLHPQLPDLLGRGCRHEFFSIISTNLSRKLTAAQRDALLLSGLGMLSASVDGVDAETYSQYRRGGDFNLVLDNLYALVRRKRELGLAYPLLEWRYLVFEHNQDDVEDAERMAGELGLDLWEFFPGYAPVTADSSESVRPTTRPLSVRSVSGPALEAGKTRQDTTMRRYLAGRLSQVRPVRTPDSLCDWLYFSAMVYPDGSIGPCCVATDQDDDFALLNGQSFVSAWNVKSFLAARQRASNGMPSGTVCDHCPLPLARRYQFIQRLRALLWNAPDWALRILSAAPDDFFLADDDFYLPWECEAIQRGSMVNGAADADTAKRLRQEASKMPLPAEVVQYLIKLAETPFSEKPGVENNANAD